MKKENILRIHRKEILDNFIISFYSTDNSISSYCKANLPQIWTKNTAKYQVQKITESDYEETLIKYFQSPFIEQNEQPLLVLVGGIGAGKSASVRYSLSNSNICEGCLFSEECAKNYPDRILVDFINFKTSVITSTPENVQKKRAISLYNNFWYHIIKILDEVINCEMDSKTEISMFWNWLMSTQSNAIPIEIYKLLFPKKDRFSDYSANSAELYELKEMIYEKLDVKGLAHYKLFQIAFLRVKKSSNCNFVIFDNIDTLAPYLQAELINFTLEAHRLLNCKAVIPIRPHTLTTNKDASDFFEIIEHWKPSLNTVFKKRLENFEKNGNPEVYYALDQLIKLIKSSNVFTDLFIATSGKSIRYALRNFYNFCLSPLIVTHINNARSLIELDLNTFFQAYFCTELKSQTLDEDNYQNLLSIKRSINDSYLSNIKLRLLHLLYVFGHIRLGKLFSILKAFGYTRYEILTALNEFLDNKKALFWSSSLTQYSKKDLKSGKDHIIQITHLGKKYYEILLSQPMYFRECLTSIDNVRAYSKKENISSVIKTLKDLEYFDYSEIAQFVENRSVEEYVHIYGSKLSIANILWLRVRDNLRNWIGNSGNIEFDYNRNFFITKTVQGNLDRWLE